MRTTFRRKGPPWALILAAAALCAVVLLARGPLSGLLWSLLSPVYAAREALFSSSAAQLRAELASTTAALADRDLLVKENSELRAQLGRSGERREVMAGVIARPPSTPYDTLMLDAGERHGVVLGARVRAGAVELGTIDAVWENTSRMVLYSSAGQTYEASVIESGVPVSVEGQGGGSLRGQVPANTEVRVGDTVSLPGILGGITAAVSAVELNSGESFKTLYLRVPLNPLHLRFVYISL